MAELFKNVAWDDFRLVKAVADGRGLPGGAAQLGLNHSTVFRRLGQIEDALGTLLFERHRTGYVLTPAGEEMVELASRLDDDITAFTRKLAGREIAPAGELRVTSNDSLTIHLLTPLFARFCRQCPDIRLEVVLGNQALNLSKRDADVAIRATDNPPEILVGRRVARLANLEYPRVLNKDGTWVEPSEQLIGDAELDKLALDLSKILDHVRELDTLDVSDVPPTSHAVPLPTRFRDDLASAPSDTDALLEGAPQRVGDAIAVPKIVE